MEPIMSAMNPSRHTAAATLLRRTVRLTTLPVRPYFTICALEGWRRIPIGQLADWSGLPLSTLKHRLAKAKLTPASVAAWTLALHAAWMLDVAELPAGAVASCMRLGRSSALGAVLGARGVRYTAGRVEPGAFAATLERYMAVLHASFPT
jgi:hypothetical protein